MERLEVAINHAGLNVDCGRHRSVIPVKGRYVLSENEIFHLIL
jgi:hypothetical protein